MDTDRLRDLMINDGGFAFDPSNGYTYNINETGMDLIRWLKQGDSEQRLLERLTSEYQVDDDIAERDLGAFLDTLRRYRLLDDGEPAP